MLHGLFMLCVENLKCFSSKEKVYGCKKKYASYPFPYALFQKHKPSSLKIALWVLYDVLL